MFLVERRGGADVLGGVGWGGELEGWRALFRSPSVLDVSAAFRLWVRSTLVSRSLFLFPSLGLYRLYVSAFVLYCTCQLGHRGVFHHSVQPVGLYLVLYKSVFNFIFFLSILGRHVVLKLSHVLFDPKAVLSLKHQTE